MATPNGAQNAVADANAQSQNTPANTPDASGGGQQPVGGGNGSNQGPKRFEYLEDRTDWVPRTALNEHNPKFKQRLTAAEQERDTYRTQLEAERQRTRALAGLEPVDEDANKRKEVKALILEMFPELGEIPKLKEQNQNAMSVAEQAQVAHWERHSTSMISELETEVANALGVEKLTERQSKQLKRAYADEAQAAVNARFESDGNGGWVPRAGHDASNDFLARHERGDKALLKAFAKEYVSDWFEPARRQVTSQVTRRAQRPVPNGSRSGVVKSQTPEINYNNEADFKKAIIDARRGGSE
jgi:hypothetical protein